ncbi:hypothetical protein IF2G_05885 [Cordyceps javanica]|nr:hypothetical protein IF2G_05885 [Cordyceps javanica]
MYSCTFLLASLSVVVDRVLHGLASSAAGPFKYKGAAGFPSKRSSLKKRHFIAARIPILLNTSLAGSNGH